MKNPWEDIPLDAYEKHMQLDDIQQLQALNHIMKEQFYTYPITSIMILGVAGGNGLEHIDKQRIKKVTGVDINPDYLAACASRYPHLQEVWEPICVDLQKDISHLPQTDMLISNLLIEYIGYPCFMEVLKQVSPSYVSCVIQCNIDDSFVSDSPYLHVFDNLSKVHHDMEEETLIKAMKESNYTLCLRKQSDLPNGKALLRLDFKHILQIVDGHAYHKEIKDLIQEYVDALQRDLSFQALDEELKDLSNKYGGEHGRLLAAIMNNEVVGCVAYQKVNARQCEMKRLYVKPAYRKHGIAQQLLSKILSLAKQDGYEEMVLDTIPPLKAAITLYKKFNFQEIEPYYDNPMEDVVYMGRKI